MGWLDNYYSTPLLCLNCGNRENNLRKKAGESVTQEDLNNFTCSDCECKGYMAKRFLVAPRQINSNSGAAAGGAALVIMGAAAGGAF